MINLYGESIFFPCGPAAQVTWNVSYPSPKVALADAYLHWQQARAALRAAEETVRTAEQAAQAAFARNRAAYDAYVAAGEALLTSTGGTA